MLDDRQILLGMLRIVGNTTPEKLRDMGIHATVGYKKPKAKTHWIKLPYPSPEGFLWIGMPRRLMERCVILGGLPNNPKPTLGRIFRTVAKDAVYAYIGSDHHKITRGKNHLVLSDRTTTEIHREGCNLEFRENPTRDPPTTFPNRTRATLQDRKEMAIKIEGTPEIFLCDHRHTTILNPYKAGKSEYD